MSIYNQASLIMYPSGYKNSKVYSLKPTDGTGDLTFTRASTATRVNSSGLIEDVATGVPRIDYSGGGCGKLLLEPQRTNLVTYSEDFSNAAYTKVNLSVSSNTTNAPDGTTSADTLTTTASSGHFRISHTNADKSSFSVFAKAGTFDWIYLSFAGQGIYFNLSDGSTGVNTGIFDYDIEYYGNGWYRCTIIASPTLSNSFRLYPANNNNDLSGTGSVYVWGSQVEAGSYPTSYIPTAGATATRLKDTPFITAMAVGLGLTNQFTWFAEVELGSNNAGLSFEPLDKTGNRIGIASILRTQTTIVSGKGQIGSPIVTYSDTSTVKLAVSYDAGAFYLAVNGNLSVIEGTVTAVGALDVMRLYSTYQAFKMQSLMILPLKTRVETTELTTL